LEPPPEIRMTRFFMQTIIGGHQQGWHGLELANCGKRQEPPIGG